MNDKPIIVAGLAVFVVLGTFPIWYTLGFSEDPSPPDLEIPQGECVDDAEWMRANHMNLLKDWRQEVVREGDKTMIVAGGQEYQKSLTNGCMKCHVNRQTFCYECHKYTNAVQLLPLRGTDGSQRGISCWNCHLEELEPRKDPLPLFVTRLYRSVFSYAIFTTL